MQLRKIEYPDKQASVLVSSRYTMTSVEANEIKHVVNNLIDELYANSVDSKKVFAYTTIHAPSQEWDSLVVELSDRSSFQAGTVSSMTLSERLDDIQYRENFREFVDGKWQTVEQAGSSSELLVCVSSFVVEGIDPDESYVVAAQTFCRYFFKNGEQVVASGPVNLLVNDIQTFKQHDVTPLILFSEDEVQIATSGDVAKLTQSLIVEGDSHVAPSAFILDDGELMPVSAIQADYVAPAPGQVEVVEVEATVRHRGLDYGVSRRFIVKADKIVDPFIASTNFTSTGILNVKGISKLTGEVQPYISRTTSLVFPDSGVIVDGSRVVIRDGAKTSFNAVSVDGQDFPISISVPEASALEVEMQDVVLQPGSYVSYVAKQRMSDGSVKTVTSADGLRVTPIGTSKLTVANSRITAAAGVETGEYAVLFECVDVSCYKKVICKNDADLPVTISTSGLVASLQEGATCSGIHVGMTMDGHDEADATGTVSVVCGPGMTAALVDGSISLTPVIKDERRVEQIDFRLITANGVVTDTRFVEVVPEISELLLKVFDSETDEEAGYELTAEKTYNVKAYIKKSDGSEVDVTASATISIVGGAYDSLSGSTITPAKLKARRNILLHASFTSSSGKTIEADKGFYVEGYEFVGASVIGSDLAVPGSSYAYYVEARYSDGTTIKVPAEFAASEEISTMLSSYDSSTLELTITPRRSLTLKNLSLSGSYQGDGDHRFESAVAVKNVTVTGGFMTSIVGSIIVSYTGSDAQLIPLSSENHFIESIEDEDFTPAYMLNVTLAEDTTINKAFFTANVPESLSGKFELAEISGDSVETFISPVKINNVEAKTVPAGSYSIKLFNPIDSADCEYNSYLDEKETQVYMRPAGVAESNVQMSSLISGDPFRYYDCLIYETDLTQPIAYGDALTKTWSFKAGKQYKVEFNPISKKLGSINSYLEFAIGKSFTIDEADPFYLAFENLTIGEGLQILDVYATFRTTNNRLLFKKFSYASELERPGSWKWISDGFPMKVKELVSMMIVFAFKED